MEVLKLSTKLKKALAICALLLFGAVTISVDHSGEKEFVHVETYKVRSGDTFWTISQYYRDLDARDLYIFEYQDELRELNPQLKNNGCQLKPNDLITVKYVKKAE